MTNNYQEAMKEFLVGLVILIVVETIIQTGALINTSTTIGALLAVLAPLLFGLAVLIRLFQLFGKK